MNAAYDAAAARFYITWGNEFGQVIESTMSNATYGVVVEKSPFMHTFTWANSDIDATGISGTAGDTRTFVRAVGGRFHHFALQPTGELVAHAVNVDADNFETDSRAVLAINSPVYENATPAPTPFATLGYAVAHDRADDSYIIVATLAELLTTAASGDTGERFDRYYSAVVAQETTARAIDESTVQTLAARHVLANHANDEFVETAHAVQPLVPPLHFGAPGVVWTPASGSHLAHVDFLWPTRTVTASSETSGVTLADTENLEVARATLSTTLTKTTSGTLSGDFTQRRYVPAGYSDAATERVQFAWGDATAMRLYNVTADTLSLDGKDVPFDVSRGINEDGAHPAADIRLEFLDTAAGPFLHVWGPHGIALRKPVWSRPDLELSVQAVDANALQPEAAFTVSMNVRNNGTEGTVDVGSGALSIDLPDVEQVAFVSINDDAFTFGAATNRLNGSAATALRKGETRAFELVFKNAATAAPHDDTAVPLSFGIALAAAAVDSNTTNNTAAVTITLNGGDDGNDGDPADGGDEEPGDEPDDGNDDDGKAPSDPTAGNGDGGRDEPETGSGGGGSIGLLLGLIAVLRPARRPLPR